MTTYRTCIEMRDQVEKLKLEVWQISTCGNHGKPRKIIFSQTGAMPYLELCCIKQRLRPIGWEEVANIYNVLYTEASEDKKLLMQEYFGFKERSKDMTSLTLKEGEARVVFSTVGAMMEYYVLDSAEKEMLLRWEKNCRHKIFGFCKNSPLSPTTVIWQEQLEETAIGVGDLFIDINNPAGGVRGHMPRGC